jgi:hypothetical protein
VYPAVIAQLASVTCSLIGLRRVPRNVISVDVSMRPASGSYTHTRSPTWKVPWTS